MKQIHIQPKRSRLKVVNRFLLDNFCTTHRMLFAASIGLSLVMLKFIYWYFAFIPFYLHAVLWLYSYYRHVLWRSRKEATWEKYMERYGNKKGEIPAEIRMRHMKMIKEGKQISLSILLALTCYSSSFCQLNGVIMPIGGQQITLYENNFSNDIVIDLGDLLQYKKEQYNDSTAYCYRKICDWGCVTVDCDCDETPRYGLIWNHDSAKYIAHEINPCMKAYRHAPVTFDGFIEWLRKKYSK